MAYSMKADKTPADEFDERTIATQISGFAGRVVHVDGLSQCDFLEQAHSRKNSCEWSVREIGLPAPCLSTMSLRLEEN